MPKLKFEWLDREEFVTARYVRYLETKAYVDSIDPNRERSVLTDLDRPFDESGRLLKDTVVCDRCNENIADPKFVRLESQMVYHAACVHNERWFRPMLETLFGNNVLSFTRR